MTRGVLTGMARGWGAALLLLTLVHAPAVAAPSHAIPHGLAHASSVPVGVKPGATGPQPGILQYEGDWAVGCDNLLQCEAIALQPEGRMEEEDEPLLLQIIRAGGPAGEAAVRVSGLNPLPPDIRLTLDGREVARFAVQSDEAVIHGPDALRAVQNMVSAVTIELRAGGRRKGKGGLLLTLSNIGLVDSLRFVDTRQGRIGTASAFVARGSAAETGIPVPPAMPVIRQVPSPDGDAAPALNAAELAVARRLAVCDAMLMANGVVELFPLDDVSALLLLPCEAGAYNISAVPLIARGPAGARTLSIARFDLAPGFTGEPGKPPLVVNALWDAHRGVLSSLAKGRGVGDCGASENYVWDGAMFRLIESRAMHVCRGAWEWVRLWAAMPQRTVPTVVGPSQAAAAPSSSPR